MKKPLIERLRAKKQNRSMVVGVTWYTEETWAQVKATARDPRRFEDTFVEWEVVALHALGDLQKVGIYAVKVQLLPAELLSWCLAHKKENDAAARAAFVSEKVRGYR